MLARAVPRVLRNAILASLPLVAALACSGSGQSGGDVTGGAGGSAAGASGSSVAGSNPAGAAGKSSGGSTTAGTSAEGGEPGGSGTKGGQSAGGAGGSVSNGGKGGGTQVEPGDPCTANCPTGMVDTCFDNCPLGACDDGLFYADVPCSMYYPTPVSKDTIFCSKGQTATYCLSAIDKAEYNYQVSCTAGKPTVTKCDGGCGVDSNHVAACN